MFESWTKSERIGGLMVVALVGASVYLLKTRSAKAAESSALPKTSPLPGGGTVTTLPEVTITSDGSGPSVTWKGPLPPTPESYRTGLTTAKVQALLSALAKIESNPDFDPKSTEGAWDGPTALAVMAYQVDRRLTIDGKVGPNTAKAMNTDMARYALRLPPSIWS